MNNFEVIVNRVFIFSVCAILVSGGMPTILAAQDSVWTWADEAELSFVWTAGNSSTSTLGIKNTLTGEGGRSKLAIELGGIRTESTVKTRVATGTPTNFTVSETSESELTAESFFAKGRYDLSFTESSYWFVGTDWVRNTFSGIEHRVTWVSGIGHQWAENDDFEFRTDVGVTYTLQDNVAIGPTDRFGGIRFSYDLRKSITENAFFASKLVLDESVDDTDDVRGDWTNSLTVAMSSRLALKTGVQLLFDNMPSLVDVPLVQGGVDTGNTVLAELEKVDSVFTVALVIGF